MLRRGMQERLENILLLLERIETSLVVRDPGNVRSAESFDGLRKQVAMSARSRRTHVSHLLTLEDDLRKGASLETISGRVRDFLSELGVKQIDDVGLEGAFQFDGEGESVRVLEPAWVDVTEDGTRIVVRQGRAARTNGESK